MAQTPLSTPTPDAAAAQTRRGTPGVAAALPRRSTPIAFKFGSRLTQSEQVAERRRRQRTDPLYRPLHIFTLDPAQPKLDGKVAVANVPWEPLEKGPIGRLFEIDSAGPNEETLEPLDLDEKSVLLDRGLRPTTSDFRFHRQMAYAVCSSVYDSFFKALGRDLSWGFCNPPRLLVRPFAFEGQNAFYDPTAGELRFGYFPVRFSESASDTVYTSLSHDIIAHELTHALLDGLRRNFIVPTNPDVFAFHEALADLVAIFHHFSYREIVRVAIRDSCGNLAQNTILSGIARQFGEGLGLGTVLRTAIDFSEGVPAKKYDRSLDPHALGAVLVAAVFDTFTRVFRRKTERLVRLATGGTGTLPAGRLPHDLLNALADEASDIATQFLVICIRAVDYCPPVDITFGEFLRAVITADRDLVPDDPWAYREAWLDAFRLRAIFPTDVRHMTEDAIEWQSPETPVTIPELDFARLKFSGDPAHVVPKEELCRQATALGNAICARDLLEEFGLAAAGNPDLRGDPIDPPMIESIRASRRIGPDGQIVLDLVAEVTQTRYVDRNGIRFPFYGGSTIIIGPDGDVRFVIRKGVRNNARVETTAAFLAAHLQFWKQNGMEWEPVEQPFQLLHEAK